MLTKYSSAVLCCAVLGCAVLGWAGLGCAGLGWAGLGWALTLLLTLFSSQVPQADNLFCNYLSRIHREEVSSTSMSIDR